MDPPRGWLAGRLAEAGWRASAMATQSILIMSNRSGWLGLLTQDGGGGSMPDLFFSNHFHVLAPLGTCSNPTTRSPGQRASAMACECTGCSVPGCPLCKKKRAAMGCHWCPPAGEPCPPPPDQGLRLRPPDTPLFLASRHSSPERALDCGGHLDPMEEEFSPRREPSRSCNTVNGNELQSDCKRPRTQRSWTGSFSRWLP